MTATAGVPAEVASYLDALRSALGDLPRDEREDLLAEVEASLLDAVEEGERPIAARLGPPDEFAAELRASAGLHPLPTAPRRSATIAQAARRLVRDPRLDGTRRLGRELAPIGWLARAYLAVAAITLLTGGEWASSASALPRLGGAGSAVRILVAAAAVSVAAGLWARRGGPRVRTAAAGMNLLLVALAIPVAVHAAGGGSGPSSTPVPAEAPALAAGLLMNGTPVQNVYAYGRDGRMLLDVRLYDQDGRPLDVRPGSVDPDRRVVVDARGRRADNAFPIRYYAPGTRRVAHPTAGSRLRPAPIRTPPLVPPRRRP